MPARSFMLAHAQHRLQEGIHTSLEDAEEEPRREKTVIVLDEALERRGEAEHKHAEREPEMGFKFLKDDVRGDFEYCHQPVSQ